VVVTAVRVPPDTRADADAASAEADARSLACSRSLGCCSLLSTAPSFLVRRKTCKYANSEGGMLLVVHPPSLPGCATAPAVVK